VAWLKILVVEWLKKITPPNLLLIASPEAWKSGLEVCCLSAPALHYKVKKTYDDHDHSDDGRPVFHLNA